MKELALPLKKQIREIREIRLIGSLVRQGQGQGSDQCLCQGLLKVLNSYFQEHLVAWLFLQNGTILAKNRTILAKNWTLLAKNGAFLRDPGRKPSCLQRKLSCLLRGELVARTLPQ